MVLPAPVGPTMAIFWLGFTLKLKFLIIGILLSYANFTFLNSILPFTSSNLIDFVRLLSSSSSPSFKNSNTLSLDAAALCSAVRF